MHRPYLALRDQVVRARLEVREDAGELVRVQRLPPVLVDVHLHGAERDAPRVPPVDDAEEVQQLRGREQGTYGKLQYTAQMYASNMRLPWCYYGKHTAAAQPRRAFIWRLNPK